ncbi:MAG: hypothetical protein HY314_09700 [Acidobacteria bacterium]|nr:hypothetical protein [Acidobacteriota bacterium]
MSTKGLWITVIVFTILIFGGNHYAARMTDSDPCTGKIKLYREPTRGEPKEPSCSVEGTVFGFNRLKDGDTITIRNAPPINGLFERLILCDRGMRAEICFGERNRDGTTECDEKVSVDLRVVTLACVEDPFVKPPRKRILAVPEVHFTGGGVRGKRAMQGPEGTDDQPGDEIITSAARVRMIQGDGGVETAASGRGDVVMVAAGKAEVQSFCIGDTVQSVGPSALSLPACQFDVSGRWKGAYARRLPDGSLEPVRFSLNLRKESNSLRGELTTSDGTFNIVMGSHFDSTLVLEAEGTVAGGRREIHLSGNVTKGDLSFEGNEESPPSAFYNIVGFAERLSIADNAVPSAVLNQPLQLHSAGHFARRWANNFPTQKRAVAARDHLGQPDRNLERHANRARQL